jgi:hypothetical protein
MQALINFGKVIAVADILLIFENWMKKKEIEFFFFNLN